MLFFDGMVERHLEIREKMKCGGLAALRVGARNAGWLAV